MTNTALERLPTARDIATEIYETAQRGRQLRALYRVLRKIEQQKPDTPDNTAADRPEVNRD